MEYQKAKRRSSYTDSDKILLSYKRWFIALNKTLSKSNVTLNAETLDNTPSYTLAQKILDMPVDRALSALAEWSDDESEED